MGAQLIFISDDDNPTTYLLDSGTRLTTRDAVIARALMDYVLKLWDHQGLRDSLLLTTPQPGSDA